MNEDSDPMAYEFQPWISVRVDCKQVKMNFLHRTPEELSSPICSASRKEETSKTGTVLCIKEGPHYDAHIGLYETSDGHSRTVVWQ